jgi:hypothetical protein
MLYGEGIVVNLPIDRLFLNLYHMGNNIFRAELMLQAGSLPFPVNVVIYLLETGEPDSVLKTLFFANTPAQNDRNIEFPSALLSEEDISSLLKIFMNTWK